MSWLDPTLANPAIGGFPGALVFAGNGPNSCKCRNDLNTYYMNYQPRIGLAFSLNPKNGNTGRLRRDDHAPADRLVAAQAERSEQTCLGSPQNQDFNSLDNGISPAFYWENNVPAYQKAPFFDPSLNTGFTTTQRQGGPDFSLRRSQ